MQYIIRELPKHWSVAKLYFPKFENEEYKAIEIVFSQTKQPIPIEYELTEDMKNKNISIFYADGKGNLSKCRYSKKQNKIHISTKHVGVYVLVETKKREFSFFKGNLEKYGIRS